MDFDTANGARFDTSNNRSRGAGHYESWFLRANHPTRPLAFWVRYTIFAPRARPEDTKGELWAIWFDGERGTHVAARREVPFERCRFAAHGLDVRVDDAALDEATLAGAIGDDPERLSWSLAYSHPEPPLLLLPERLYSAPLPRAKQLVPAPNALFTGQFSVGASTFDIDAWQGSQAHNWGSQHTDRYAWGQVAGFDGAPDAFFEASTVRLLLSRRPRLWSPWLTVAVLRTKARTLSFVSPLVAARATASFELGRWSFVTRQGEVELEATLRANDESFVGLTYRNPPGGTKICHNTKLARCDLRIGEPGRSTYLTSDRAAFEILDDTSLGISVVV